MSKNTSTRNIFTILFFCCLLAFQPFETAAQCGGTYFKKLSTTLFQINGTINFTADMNGDGIPDLVGRKFNTGQSASRQFIILPSVGSGGFGTPITLQRRSDHSHEF
jgi:hypothetical protein